MHRGYFIAESHATEAAFRRANVVILDLPSAQGESIAKGPEEHLASEAESIAACRGGSGRAPARRHTASTVLLARVRFRCLHSGADGEQFIHVADTPAGEDIAGVRSGGHGGCGQPGPGAGEARSRRGLDHPVPLD